MNQDDKIVAIVKQLADALKTADYELATLYPRLTPQYRKSIEMTRAKIKAALEFATKQ